MVLMARHRVLAKAMMNMVELALGILILQAAAALTVIVCQVALAIHRLILQDLQVALQDLQVALQDQGVQELPVQLAQQPLPHSTLM